MQGTVKKTGIVWNIRTNETEISIAETSGPVRTFKCEPEIFDHIRQDGIREGSYIDADFDFKRKIITRLEHVKLVGKIHSVKRKASICQVRSPVMPLIKSGKNGRVMECKLSTNFSHPFVTHFMHKPTKFHPSQDMDVVFSLYVNKKKTNPASLRNSPYLDVITINLKEIAADDDNVSHRSSMSSMAITEPPSTPIDSWMARRMSSPRQKERTQKPSNKRTNNNQKTPEKKRKNNTQKTNKTKKPKISTGFTSGEGILSAGHRSRGRPLQKASKRDPGKPSHSAPVTPLKELATPDLPDTYEEFNAAIQERTWRRRTRESEKRQQMEDLIHENDFLEQDLLNLRARLQYESTNVSHSTHDPPPVYGRHRSKNVQYIQDPGLYHNVFSKSPSVSPSSSPERVFDMHGHPSSIRSDTAFGQLSTQNYDRQYDYPHRNAGANLNEREYRNYYERRHDYPRRSMQFNLDTPIQYPRQSAPCNQKGNWIEVTDDI